MEKNYLKHLDSVNATKARIPPLERLDETLAKLVGACAPNDTRTHQHSPMCLPVSAFCSLRRQRLVDHLPRNKPIHELHLLKLRELHLLMVDHLLQRRQSFPATAEPAAV